MLVLTRKVGEQIHIGDDIVITVARIHQDKVRIGIDAPADVRVNREEVQRRSQRGPTPAELPLAEKSPP